MRQSINFKDAFGTGVRHSDDTINSKNQIDIKIKADGYNIVEVYECELKKNKTFMKFIKTWEKREDM